MKGSNPRFNFGMKCVQCGNELIAPEGLSTGAIGAPVIFGTAGNAVAVSTFWSCFLRDQVNEKYDDKRRYFPVAAGRIGPVLTRRMVFSPNLVRRRTRPPHRFSSGEASTFRTFDWQIPNCRAIREGVMPALRAARTAFS